MSAPERPADSSFERIIAAVTLIAFWSSFTSLAAGLSLWFAFPGSDTGSVCLSAGLLGLLLIPVLRLVSAIGTAIARRDWMLLASAMLVLLILVALTLRDALAH